LAQDIYLETVGCLSPKVWEDWKRAESKGAFFNQSIRGLYDAR
jgi:hypothetical protein